MTRNQKFNGVRPVPLYCEKDYSDSEKMEKKIEKNDKRQHLK